MSEKKLPRGEAENLHSGHRQRMLEAYLNNGMSGFSDVEVLEFLLAYAIPRVDTNVIAHRLLNEFGTLYQVFEAPVELLKQVKGVGPRAAVLIHFTAALWNRTEESRFRSERYLRNTKDIGNFLVAKIGSLREERTFMISLDNNCKLLDFREMTRGSIASVNLPFRMILQTALMVNASSVVLAHNHIGESCVPSAEDLEYTRTIRDSLKRVDIVLADHFIIAERSYLSMKYSGMLNF